MMRLPTLAACMACALTIFPLHAQDAPATSPADPSTVTAPAPAAGVPAAAVPATVAAPAAPSVPVGNAVAGRELTYTCQGCHGVVGYKNAYPNFHVPRIGGQSVVYLSNALHEYRRGERKHPTMQVQAQSFSEQDIADIAAYLAGLKGASSK